MRRLLRLLALCLFALAATAMARHAASRTMTMPDGHVMAAAGMPCHEHLAVDQTGGGDCCGPIVLQRSLLAVTPVAERWATLPRVLSDAAPTLFLTGGTERPPRRLLA